MDGRMTDESHFFYPPQYDEIRAWVREQKYITHSILQQKFNLTYGHSKLTVEALVRDGVIIAVSSPQGRYDVLK
jgi:ribosomal protein S25